MKVLGIIALVLFGGYAIAQFSAARRTGKYLQDLATQEPDKVMDALAALRDRGGAVGPALAGLLQAGQEEAAPRAAWLLGMIGSHAGDQALIQALNSDKPVLRLAAVQALGQLRAAAALPGIAGILGKTEEKNEIRVMAAYAVGTIGGPDALNALLGALGERPKKQQPTAPEAAAAAPAASATPPAPAPAGAKPAAAAKPGAPAAPPAPPPDTTIPVRIAAARALGWLRDPQAIPALAMAITEEEPDPEVRVAAAYSLGDATAASSEEAASHLGVEALLKGLQDKVGDVRIASAYALSKTKPPSDIEKRKEIGDALRDTAEKDDHYWARRAAERSVAMMRLPE